MSELSGKRIVLGISGGIACYKSAELVRRLMDHGAQVDVVMTESAKAFVTSTTFQALSGNPVHSNLWDNQADNSMAHIQLTRQADMVLIAPATTNVIAKLANGICDDLLTTLCMASPIPIMVAPAMNKEMWRSPANARNIRQLVEDGVQVWGPAQGIQACGETGEGRMLEPNELVSRVRAHFQPKLLTGVNVLMTAGPTCEPIDPVRVITNRSSGKTGYALAQAAQESGANVTLISGPTNLACPVGVDRINVQTAQQMYDAVLPRASANDIFIAVAAVADWRVENASAEKLKKVNGQAPDLHFAMNPDILHSVASLPNSPWCVGFAAETTLDPAQAQLKRQRKGVPLLIANLAQHVMDADHTEVELFDEQGMTRLGSGHKMEIARQLIQEISQRYRAYQA